MLNLNLSEHNQHIKYGTANRSDLNGSHGWDNNIRDLLTVLDLSVEPAVVTDFISYVASSATADDEFVSTNMFVEKVNGRDICI